MKQIDSAIETQAETLRLSRELSMLQTLVAELTPYEGELPQTLEQYRALPEAHQRQLSARQPEHVAQLMQVEELLEQAQARDRQEEGRQAELAGLPVTTPDAFAALDERERAQLAMTLTRRQRLALCGERPREDGAFL
jgi:hypothetical protein